MIDTQSAIDVAVERVIEDFQKYPGCYFTEEDVRWRLMRDIEDALATLNIKHVRLKDGNGIITSLVHGEYPTPFRCSMDNRSFALEGPESKKGRGHFDIVVLNPATTAGCEFEVIRAQDYQRFLSKLRDPSFLPFLDGVIEIKLFRDLIHPNRSASIRQQAEYAVQAIKKVAETLKGQPKYCHKKPFAKRGMVLLFDNSEAPDVGNVELARSHFLEAFEKTEWDSIPDTLLCVWVTPCPMQKRKDYRGRKRLVY